MHITMNSEITGTLTSKVEITHILSHGTWLLSGEKELFMPYTDFPWFKDAPVGKLLNVTEPTPGHFF
jgi:hypothetical protein